MFFIAENCFKKIKYCILNVVLGVKKVKEKLEQYLIKFNRKTITLSELEAIFPSSTDYEQFSQVILQLENENVLEMVKSQGRNSFEPSLAYKYRIHKHRLKNIYYKDLQLYRTKFHHEIDLDAYFLLDPVVFYQDLPYLEKINKYIRLNGLPSEKVPAPERSFEIVQNEKWIEKGGIAVLDRTNLFEKLKVASVSDPLMMAINPQRINDKKQYHLIVENKTTYQALLPAIVPSSFATLIYGVGQKIAKSIENFAEQYPVQAEHVFYYFGDIDYSGIKIWFDVNKRVNAIPALPFYEACFMKNAGIGKTNQTKNETALEQFVTYSNENFKMKILNLLDEGKYYPQETLKTKELQTILLETNWADYDYLIDRTK